MRLFAPALALANARLPGGSTGTLRIAAGRIAAIGDPPRRGDAVLDCAGDWLTPGLINAHDHLELNNFPRLKWRERYTNAREWIADFQPRFASDPALTGPLCVPLADRLFIGGIKNLLCGATTVQHHNPLHADLRRGDFPVRVVRHYGWSHSLLIDGGRAVQAACRRTLPHRPWLIHAAEGVDAEAAGELARLDALDCVCDNTLIVHGVGLQEDDRLRMIARGAGLIWCPSSNLFLLGQTAQVTMLATCGLLALGSDSRLSGAGDLLDELCTARETGLLDERALYAAVTENAARLLRLQDASALRVGAPADLLLMDGAALRDGWLGRAARRNVALVLIGGRARFSSPRYAEAFALTGQHAAPLRVDGAPKHLARPLAERLRRCAAAERGVE